jgi:hypothetical protein
MLPMGAFLVVYAVRRLSSAPPDVTAPVAKLGTQVPLRQIPLTADPIWRERWEAHQGDTYRIEFDFYDLGEMVRSGVEFAGVRAVRMVPFLRCTAWHFGASCTITEVLGSPWLEELARDDSGGATPIGHAPLHHYMLYFDEEGCYEVAASSWSMLPEELVGSVEVRVFDRTTEAKAVEGEAPRKRPRADGST